MSALGLVTGTTRRQRGSRPQLPLVNMFAEKAVTEPQQFVLLSRPGIEYAGTTLSGGPVQALFWKNGVLSGHLVAVSGGVVHVNGLSAGDIAGSVTASIAGNEIGIVATAGGTAKFHDGAALSSVDFPDGALVTKVVEQGGRFLMLRAGTQRFYWTPVLADMLVDGIVTVDGLDYASAESEPDELLDAVTFQDTLALLGSTTIEFWTKTGDSELPYVPISGRVFTKGIKATGCAALFDNTLAWVSPDNIVYLAGNVPERISDGGIEDLIAASDGCRVDTFFLEGHEFLKVALSDATALFDAQTRQWCEFSSYGANAWLAGPGAGNLFGSLTDGRLFRFGEGYVDLAGQMERRFRAYLPLSGGGTRIANLRLRTAPGRTDYTAGDGADPVVEMRFSYDDGATWEDWEATDLGEQGRYAERIEWRALGMFADPGALFEFRVTDPVPFPASGVAVNEPGGGRAR